ncbi:MAG: hypothetical protein MJ182_09800 [Treponema sp.]|nr:hypothetical protein [Treponema sp.]
MSFWPILVIAVIIFAIFLKEEKTFDKERKNPHRKKGFYHPTKLESPSEIAEEARKLEAMENEEN